MRCDKNSKPAPNFSKPSQASPSSSQIFPRKTLEFPLIPLSEMSLFNGYPDPLGRKSFCFAKSGSRRSFTHAGRQ
jgi:hypothetical protein